MVCSNSDKTNLPQSQLSLKCLCVGSAALLGSLVDLLHLLLVLADQAAERQPAATAARAAEAAASQERHQLLPPASPAGGVRLHTVVVADARHLSA